MIGFELSMNFKLVCRLFNMGPSVLRLRRQPRFLYFLHECYFLFDSFFIMKFRARDYCCEVEQYQKIGMRKDEKKNHLSVPPSPAAACYRGTPNISCMRSRARRQSSRRTHTSSSALPPPPADEGEELFVSGSLLPQASGPLDIPRNFLIV